jgi:hypothetical protein
MNILIPILLFVAVLIFGSFYVKETFFDRQQCGALANCKDCAKAGGCVWCLNKQVCVASDRFGFPSGRECSGNDVVSFSNNCDNVPVNQGKPQTIQVSKATDSSLNYNTAGSNVPAWLSSALRGGYTSGLQSGGAQAYKKMIGGLDSSDNMTYDTDMTQAYYKQFGYDSPTKLVPSTKVDPSISESAVAPKANDTKETVNFDYKTLEDNLIVRLTSSIQDIIAQQLKRNGLGGSN